MTAAPVGPRWRKSSHSASSNCAEVGAWRKSSHSGEESCTEVGQDGTVVLVRDTTDRGGAVLMFSAAAWERFAAKVKRGT